jgi:hypothetical protein
MKGVNPLEKRLRKKVIGIGDIGNAPIVDA